MICRVCHGSGSFFAVQPNVLTKIKEYRWFSCPSCNGLGTIDVDNPSPIRMHQFKGVVNKKAQATGEESGLP